MQEIKYSGINTLSRFKKNIFEKIEEKLIKKIDIVHGEDNAGKVLAIDETGNASPQSMKLGQFENDLYGEQKEMFLDLTLEDFVEDDEDSNGVNDMLVYMCDKQDWLKSVDDFEYEFEMVSSNGGALAYSSVTNPAVADEGSTEEAFMCSFANGICIMSNGSMVEDALMIIIPTTKAETTSLSLKIRKLVTKKIPAKYLEVTMTGIDITESEIDEAELNSMLEEVFD